MNWMMVRLVQMYRMSIWDRKGRMYMPVYGYNGEISNYAPAKEALGYWQQEFEMYYMKGYIS